MSGENLRQEAWTRAAERDASAAPRQPEGDAISRERVQAEADAFFDWPTTDKSSVTTTSCLIFARCIAGMVAAERDSTIAELREECERLNANIGRLSSNPADHRYWEGRYRDEAAQRDKLAGLLHQFVERDGYTSYISDEEKEADTLVVEARAALADLNT